MWDVLQPLPEDQRRPAVVSGPPDSATTAMGEAAPHISHPPAAPSTDCLPGFTIGLYRRWLEMANWLWPIPGTA